MDKIKEAIGLLNSMVECGEKHSDRSHAVVQEALSQLSALQDEIEKIRGALKLIKTWNANDGDGYDGLEIAGIIETALKGGSHD